MIVFSRIIVYKLTMKNRRDILKGLTASVLGAAFAPATALAAPSSAHPALLENMSSLLKKSNVVILADTNHDNLGLRAPLSDRPTMKALRAAGVTELFLEFPKELDNCAWTMAKDQMSRGDFIDNVLTCIENAFTEVEGVNLDKKALEETLKKTKIWAGVIADNVTTAAKAGINVYCIDPQSCLDQIKLMREIEKTGNNNLLQDRLMKHDPELAQFIKKTTQKKAVVMYGSLHSTLSMPVDPQSGLPGNIDDALRALKVKTSAVLLTDNIHTATSYYRTAQKNPQALPLLDFGKGVDVPDYVYDPIAKKGVAMQSGTVALLAKPEPRIAMK